MLDLQQFQYRIELQNTNLPEEKDPENQPLEMENF